MGGLRGKETEREEEIKMVKNSHCQPRLRSRLSGTVMDSVAFVFINRHKIFLFKQYFSALFCVLLL